MPYKDPEVRRAKQREYNRRWREEHGGKDSVAHYARSRADGSDTHSREPWSKEQDEMVLAHAVTDRVLAQQIGRSLQAVHVRRSKLKRDAERG